MKHRTGSTITSLLVRAAGLGVDLAPEQAESLLRFQQLLLDRAIPMGLVAEGDAPRIMTRHVLDSLRAAVAVEPGDHDAYDLGSGAGLPGIVVAIARPALRVSLVESRARRVGFLEIAVERLGLGNAIPVALRVEALEGPVDLCFARAFRSLKGSWAVASSLLRPGGRLVYFAGKREARLREAPGTLSRLLESPVLESAGPLVIMAQQ